MPDSIPAQHGDVMSEPEEESNFEADNVNVGLIATIALVGAACVLAIALAMTALVRAQTRTFGDEIGAYADLGTVKRLKAEQKAKLEAAAAVVDKAKGSYSVPIDRGMNAVITEIQANPSLATMAPPAAAAPSEAPPAEAPPADKDEKTKKTGAGAKGRVGMDPKNGAPVTPASAPAPHG